MSEVGTYADFVIQTKPEIRKGCVWDIGLLFSVEALSKHKLKEIYLEKPRVQRESGAYLCLKVRSKLIQKEIGFSKVGELEHSTPYIEPNVSTGCATLKLKFMQRPRAVFHRHADVMVLVVSLRSCSSNEVLMTAEKELIFRGGTGSMHSAERKKAAITPGLPNASLYHHDSSHASHSLDSLNHISHHHSFAASHGQMQSMTNTGASNSGRLTRSSRHVSTPTSVPSFAKPSAEHFAISEAVTRAHPQMATLFPSATSTGSLSAATPVSAPVPSRPSLVSRPLSSDDRFTHSNFFIQGTGAFPLDPNTENSDNAPHMEVSPLTLAAIQEFQLGLQAHKQHLGADPVSISSSVDLQNDEYDFPSAFSPNTGLTEESSNTDLDDTRELEAWAKSSGLDTGLFDGSLAQEQAPLDLSSMPYPHHGGFASELSSDSYFPSENSYPISTLSASAPETVSHSMQLSDLNVPLLSTGTLNPSSKTEGAMTRARSAKISFAKKRRADFSSEYMPMAKRSAGPIDELAEALNPRTGTGLGSFEDKVFQKLFFRSLTFLSLEELRALAQTAPLPIFVKDEQGAYLLANPAFCSFVYDESWDAIANRSAEQLLEADESERINRADEYCMEREGNIGTFYLSVKHQDYRVMKLFTKLRDCDQKLVVGAVTF